MSLGDRVTFLLITGFGTGLARIAPGTFGTVPGVLLAWAAERWIETPQMVLLTAAIVAVAWLVWGCGQTLLRDRKNKLTIPARSSVPIVADRS